MNRNRSPIEALDEPFFLYLAHDSIVNYVVDGNLAAWVGAASLFQLRFHSITGDIGCSFQNFGGCAVGVFKVGLIGRSVVLGYDPLRPVFVALEVMRRLSQRHDEAL